MAAIRQRFLVAALLAGAAAGAAGQRFYEDDPILRMPPPRNVVRMAPRPYSDSYDAWSATFASQPTAEHAERARGVNTLDEAPDSEWFVNRHARQRLSYAELLAGAGNAHPPSFDGPWEVIRIKPPGATPGFEFRDANGRHYIAKLDPPDHPELGTGAEMAASRFFHAMGYRVPEVYLVRFQLSQLQVAPGATMSRSQGRARAIVPVDLHNLLRDQPRDALGRIRATASLRLPGEPMGPFRFWGTRSDDPNDTVPHEHRRELRGLAVPAAWLHCTELRSSNTLDTLVREPGRQYLLHYLLDFNATLGSGQNGPKSPRSGFVPLIQAGPALVQLFTLGAWIPPWARARYPDLRGAGRFEADRFDPASWTSDFPLAALSLARPDDLFWGVKLVLSFTEADIRTILAASEYSDSRTVEWIVRCLLLRQEKLGRYHLERVLPLDGIAIRGGVLRFRDLSVERSYVPARSYLFRWARFDNQADRLEPLVVTESAHMPGALNHLPEGAWCAVQIHAGDAQRSVTAYFQKRQGQWTTVGVERSFARP